MRKISWVVLIIVLGAGCARNVPVQYEFPAAAIRALPISVGVYYPPSLQTYEYQEAVKEDPNWQVRLGEANVRMFDRVFSDLFSEIEHVNSTEASGVDAVIKAEVDRFEIAVPEDTELEFFEAWIQYRLTLFRPNGSEIGTWTVSGYGRDEAASHPFGRNERVSDATFRAMRDAAAALIIGFRDEPAINEWLGVNVVASETADVRGGGSESVN